MLMLNFSLLVITATTIIVTMMSKTRNGPSQLGICDLPRNGPLPIIGPPWREHEPTEDLVVPPTRDQYSAGSRKSTSALPDSAPGAARKSIAPPRASR